MNLYRFLAIFHGRRAVQVVSTQALLESRKLHCDVLFVGLPSDLTKRQLTKISYRDAVLFDYFDEPGPVWFQSDRELLTSLTDRYLKTWVEPGWENGWHFGVLPIRRHAKLTWNLRRRNRLLRRGTIPEEDREYDVMFIGNATGSGDYHQRIEWLRELRHANGRYRFWGGLVCSKDARKALEEQFGDLSELIYAGRRVGFHTYFNRLRKSRVALAPAGNARWSYRHYEAIYAGATVVSADFRNVRTLIPLPIDGMVHVPDRAPVTEAIDRALALRREHPELMEENVRFLERFLEYGDYSRNKPELMDRFMAQLRNA